MNDSDNSLSSVDSDAGNNEDSSSENDESEYEEEKSRFLEYMIYCISRIYKKNLFIS
jgi:hypothetical protein